jgi:hypothetical protein
MGGPSGRATGIVDEDMNGMEVLGHPTVEGIAQLRGTVKIGNKVAMLLAIGRRQFRDNCFQLLSIPCDERHLRAYACELDGGGFADALRAAANNCRFSVQIQFHIRPLC